MLSRRRIIIAMAALTAASPAASLAARAAASCPRLQAERRTPLQQDFTHASMPGAGPVATVVTAIVGPLVLARVEPVVHVAVLVGVVVMEGFLLRFLFVVLVFARLLVILFLIGRFRLRRPGGQGGDDWRGAERRKNERGEHEASASLVGGFGHECLRKKGIVVRRSYQVRGPHARARRTP